MVSTTLDFAEKYLLKTEVRTVAVMPDDDDSVRDDDSYDASSPVIVLDDVCARMTHIPAQVRMMRFPESRDLLSLDARLARYHTRACIIEDDSLHIFATGRSHYGASVMHFHVHLIPRRYGDGLDTWSKLPGRSLDLDTAWRRLRRGTSIS